MTNNVPATSDAPKGFTVKSWEALSQTTLGLSLEQVRGPQVGGFEESEVVSTNAGIVVGKYY